MSNEEFVALHSKSKKAELVNTCVSETLHKNIKVNVLKGEDVATRVNLENWSLEETLKECVTCLELLLDIKEESPYYIRKLIDSCRGWIQDEREVVRDD